MESWPATSPWPGVVLWIILYISDYYLTLYWARGFREIRHFQFEGSFELTPQYQKDIDGLKPISKLHITLLVAALTFSLFFLGGAIMCAGIGLKHSRMTKKAELNPPQIVTTQL